MLYEQSYSLCRTRGMLEKAINIIFYILKIYLWFLIIINEQTRRIVKMYVRKMFLENLWILSKKRISHKKQRRDFWEKNTNVDSFTRGREDRKRRETVEHGSDKSRDASPTLFLWVTCAGCCSLVGRKQFFSPVKVTSKDYFFQDFFPLCFEIWSVGLNHI